jgi:hypothetical protein
MANLHLAPILKEVDTSLHIIKFNGSLMHENVFRLDAGPEVDAAWASMGINCEHIFHTTSYLKDMRDL